MAKASGEEAVGSEGGSAGGGTAPRALAARPLSVATHPFGTSPPRAAALLNPIAVLPLFETPLPPISVLLADMTARRL